MNYLTRTDKAQRKYIGPRNMGGKCGRGWIGLKGACKRGKKGADNAEALKASKRELADKIRKSKGMSPIASRDGKLPGGSWDISAAYRSGKETQSSILAKQTSPGGKKPSPMTDRATKLQRQEERRAYVNWGKTTGDWKQKPDSVAAMDMKSKPMTAPTPIARPLKMYEQAFRSLSSVEDELKDAQSNHDRLSQKSTKGAAQAKIKVEAEIGKLKRRRENLKNSLRQTEVGGKQLRILGAGKDSDGATIATFQMAGKKRGELIGASIRFNNGEVEHLPPATINGKIFNKDKAVFDHVKAHAVEAKDFADFVDRALPSFKKPVDASLLSEIKSIPMKVPGMVSRSSSEPRRRGRSID